MMEHLYIYISMEISVQEQQVVLLFRMIQVARIFSWDNGMETEQTTIQAGTFS